MFGLWCSVRQVSQRQRCVSAEWRKYAWYRRCSSAGVRFRCHVCVSVHISAARANAQQPRAVSQAVK